MTKILVTGGGGFVATNLLRELSSKGFSKSQILAVDRAFPFRSDSQKYSRVIEGDLSSKLFIADLLAEHEFTHVFHLAANSDIRASSSNPSLEVRDTFSTTANLAASLVANKRRLECLMFASSSAVFGNADAPISDSTPKSPVSAYGWMKLASEALLSSFSEQIANRVVIYRFPNVVGRFSTHGVIHDLCKQAIAEPPYLSVLGDGNQSKPYVLADELVRAIVTLEFGESGSRGLHKKNLGPSDTATVRFIAEAVLEALDLKIPMRFGDKPWGWEGDVPNYQFSETPHPQLKGAFSSSFAAIETAVQQMLEQIRST